MSKDITLSEEAIRRKLGTREPVRGAGQRPGPNWERKETSGTAKDTKIDPAEIRNPKLTIERRERESGMKCGGKVRKMAAGGSVRGVGCASKGTKFKGSY